LLLEKAKGYPGKLVWFSLRDDNSVVMAHVERGGLAFVYADGKLLRQDGNTVELICSAADIPLTLDGAALHNVANCLGAAALTQCLGMSLRQIRAGLTSMTQDSNPGRSNLYSVNGFRVLVDFAHNPEAMQALFAMATALPAKRRVLCFAQAGDRTDEQIRELARSAWAIGLEKAVIAELEQYRRGREEGEVYAILRDELIRAGASDSQIQHVETESESFDAALDWADEGDLVVILDLGRISGIQEKLHSMQT
jgi:UDP-N-acetylmuramyl tripeptide synthase